jgi:hypothetical protein
MQTMRESWTDERLDDLKEQVNERFNQVDKRLDRMDADIRDLRRMVFQGFAASMTVTVTCFVGLAGLMVL